MNRTLFSINIAVLVLTCFMATRVRADLVDLFDGNSSITLDTTSASGMSDWTVDGTDHLAQQWFWFRSGASGPEASLDTLTQLGIAVIDTNPFTDSRADTVSVLYGGSGGGFTIEMLYSLRGGSAGSGVSDIAEQIVIRNTSAFALDFHFYQYSDFNVGGSAPGDTVEILGGNTARQFDAASGFLLSETVVTPMPGHFEAGGASSLLGSLNDGGPTTLIDSTGPLSGSDMAWAFQWDMTIAAGGSFLISKDKSLSVPSPAGLIVLAMAGLLGCGRKRE